MKLFVLSLILLISCSVYSSDYTRFLSDQSEINVETSQGKARLFPGGHDEKYYAVDQFGNRYKLRFKNALHNYVEVGSSILIEAIGLPTLPVYPILLKRGENGVPTSEEAKALDPTNSFLGLAGERGEWFSATIQPLTKLERARTLSLENQAELFFSLVINYLVGNNDIQLGDGMGGNLGYTNGHFSILDITQGFKFYPEESNAQNLSRSYFSLFNSNVKEIDPFQQLRFLDQINYYLTKLEMISQDTLSQIFAPYFDSMKSFRKFKQLPEFDYLAELVRRRDGLRQEIASYLKGTFEERAFEFFMKPLRMVSPPHINIPKIALEFNNVPKLGANSPATLLWGYYFTDFWKLKDHAVQAWMGELGEKGDVVRSLMEKSHLKESSIYYVGKNLDIGAADDFYFKPPQLTLNEYNAKTLVVVPVNDEEAYEISKIAKRSGAHVLEFNDAHGVKLTEGMFGKIGRVVKREGIERVVICEIPDVGENNFEDKIRKNVASKLFIVDHHAYKEFDRTARYSSLEQVAHILGYNLAPSEKIVGINDRGYIYALKDLGLSKSMLIEMERLMKNGKATLDLAEKLKSVPALSTSWGDLNIVNEQIAIGEITSAFAIRDYPEIPNVLVTKYNRLRFSGDPKIVANLQELFPEVGEKFHGGDPARSMFWGMNFSHEEISLEEVKRRLADKFEVDIDKIKIDPAIGFRKTYDFLKPGSHEYLTRVKETGNSVERVKMVDQIHWFELTEAEKMQMLKDALVTTNSFERASFVQIASTSADRRWIEVLEQLDQNNWRDRPEWFNEKASKFAQAVIKRLKSGPCDHLMK